MQKPLGSRQQAGIDGPGTECLSDVGHRTTHRGQEGLPAIVEQMPPVRDLHCVWKSPGNGAGVSGPALAVSLGDMAKEAADDLESVPTLLAVAFYIIGAAIVGFGLLKLKRPCGSPAADHHRQRADRHSDRGLADRGPGGDQRAGRHLRAERRQPHRDQAPALGRRRQCSFRCRSRCHFQCMARSRMRCG